jgi:hypothetical protein
VACGEQAQVLTRGRPFVAAFPRVVTHAQAQLAVELAQRGIDVIVSFRCARVILGGVEIMHMIRKGQLRSNAGSSLSAAQEFYSLAA